MTTYTCPECGQPCQVEPEDQGIGPYEFWGQRGFDSHNVMISSCCGANMEEQISYTEWHQDRLANKADHDYDAMRDRELEEKDKNLVDYG